ncbi:hypothetical protein HK104_005544, partial [Borealophlyctis nickersoniae]
MTTPSKPATPAKPPYFQKAPKGDFIGENERALRAENRRVVYKNVFDSPFSFKWYLLFAKKSRRRCSDSKSLTTHCRPVLTAEDQENILSALCALLDSVGQVRREVSEARASSAATSLAEKRKTDPQSSELPSTPEAGTSAGTPRALDLPKKKKKKTAAERAATRAQATSAADEDTFSANADSREGASHQEGLMPLRDIEVGINNVTKRLETSVRNPGSPALRLVFLCRGDIPMAHIYQHMPPLVYLAGEDVLLCSFGKGAENLLAHALGVKTVMALGIK